ncbi:hypothetical protein JK159_04350 [Weissella minor]|uniref:hypothetical protein n=1 Tax=Weissella minor TaxID=1620 RepID=UPI001BAE6DD6|nr:hypothetical protein [Weissella minor]MBS0949596.1 hypothetical protein [Weissella minor]
MNIQTIREWLNTEWQSLLRIAHYIREYMYLPEPIGKNSKYAHDIVKAVFEILANMPIKQSNIFICRYVFMMSWHDISAMNGLTRRQNLYLENKALTYFGYEFKPVYDFSIC